MGAGVGECDTFTCGTEGSVLQLLAFVGQVGIDHTPSLGFLVV